MVAPSESVTVVTSAPSTRPIVLRSTVTVVVPAVTFLLVRVTVVPSILMPSVVVVAPPVVPELEPLLFRVTM